MNQRIKELAEQAGFYYTDKTGFITPAGCDPAKFAELIVRECVAICQDTDGEDNTDAMSGRQDCAVEIREHFGVEE
jgi:hypothetical protein